MALNLAPQAQALVDAPMPRARVREHGSPLLVLDCDSVREQYRGLASALPGVDLYYAMKALPHRAVIATLMEEGCFFDLATTGEIGLLKRLGIPATKVVHTHPIKREQDIRAALDYGCRTFVVDNLDEMAKFAPHRHRVSLLLRVSFRSTDAVVDLSKKFGCGPDDALSLLEHGNELGLDISGLSFHVGSQCGSPGAHVNAINDCAELIQRARRMGLSRIRVLDIGGGFPARYRAEVAAIDEFCEPIRSALRALPAATKVIAEPGRHLVAAAMLGITTVIGKALRAGVWWYYLDDGVYGSFSGRIYDGASYPFTVITENSDGKHHPSVLAGPTCDSIDIIAEEAMLPELRIGDLVVWGSMGAYTSASASEFNSIPRAKILVLNSPISG